MDDLVVATDALTRRFGPRVAVDSVRMNVRRGEVYGFVGPNGAGKTTTLRMLLGLVRPTSGSARVLDLPPGDPTGLGRIGVLVEAPAFYPYLSGRDNLRVFGRYVAVAEEATDRVLETVGLAKRATERVAKYSLGMKQRLGVALALLKEPELLILDEPTNGLDPAGMVEMRRLIRQIGDQGRTVLLSSHLLGEVEQTCDRIGVIASGRLVSQGTVKELRGAGALHIGVDPADEARSALDCRYGADRVTVHNDVLHLAVESHQAAAVNRELNNAGLAVWSVTWHERSLEEAFFEMTGGADGADR